MVFMTLLAIPAFAVSVKVEPGIAVPLSSPQSDIYKMGGGGSAKVLFALGRYLDFGPSAHLLLLPAAARDGNGGTAWALGGGLRLKRPHDSTSSTFSSISPWIDGDALYVRTAGFNRVGLAAAVGLAWPLGEDRSVWFGPFVRYLHILQPNTDGYDNRDAKTLVVGLSFEFGPRVERAVASLPEPPPAVAAPTPEAPPVPQKIAIVSPPPDRDGDGVPDAVDNCPDVPGPAENGGCPLYKKIVVKREKLELKEKLFFDYDKARIKPISYPVLDEVVQALAENKSFRIHVQGHTDSKGLEHYNQVLSQSRANAVVEYLVSRGIAKERLESTGFAFSAPIATNETAEGRAANRRVEFMTVNNRDNP